MGVDYGRANVLVPKQFLDRTLMGLSRHPNNARHQQWRNALRWALPQRESDLTVRAQAISHPHTQLTKVTPSQRAWHREWRLKADIEAAGRYP
jgi:hypothetical protein